MAYPGILVEQSSGGCGDLIAHSQGWRDLDTGARARRTSQPHGTQSHPRGRAQSNPHWGGCRGDGSFFGGGFDVGEKHKTYHQGGGEQSSQGPYCLGPSETSSHASVLCNPWASDFISPFLPESQRAADADDEDSTPPDEPSPESVLCRSLLRGERHTYRTSYVSPTGLAPRLVQLALECRSPLVHTPTIVRAPEVGISPPERILGLKFKPPAQLEPERSHVSLTPWSVSYSLAGNRNLKLRSFCQFMPQPSATRPSLLSSDTQPTGNRLQPVTCHAHGQQSLIILGQAGYPCFQIDG